MIKIISNPENQFVRVINLTQHPFTQDQLTEFKSAGVKDENIIDTNDEVKALITFSGDIDAEIIRMGCEFLEKLGITGLTVEINSLGNIDSRKKYIASTREVFRASE